MRVELPGIGTTGLDPYRLTVDGEAVSALPGDTVASAMVADGRHSFRQAQDGDRRGVFCGMGVCNECAVVVDGIDGHLACMTAVHDGMEVRTQSPVVSRPTVGQAQPTPPERVIAPELLVIGGGPAGLSAAATAAEAGVDVVLVDERSKLGGQYYKQPPAQRTIEEKHLDDQYREGRALIERARSAGATIIDGVNVWGVFGPDRLVAAGGAERYELRPERLVLAVGAYERGVPVPGWTLPGVMTTGAGQTLLRSSQVSPGSRVLVAGNGPLNLQLAAELVRAGVDVAALVELGDLRPWKHASLAPRLAAAPDLVRKGLGYRATLARARVPVIDRSAAIAFEGTDAVTAAIVARIGADGLSVPGTERRFDVDAVCVGYGFLPSTEIARSLGCAHHYDESAGALVAERTSSGLTSVDGVWLVGDAGGIRGAHVAAAQGTLAAAEVVASLGRSRTGDLDEAVAGAARRVERHLRFQTAMQRLFAAPPLFDELADDATVLCRCESVTLGEVRRSLVAGTESPGALKRVTRAGMGKCQGRYCGPVLAAMTSRRTGVPIDEFASFAPQPPAKPIAISLAAAPPTGGHE